MNSPNPNPSKPGGKRKAMKHILKKFHLSTSTPDPTSTSPDSASASSDPRPPAAAGPGGVGGGGSGSPQSSPSSSPAPASGEQEDYFASEEEFQVQLALAISASSSSSPAVDRDFRLRDDPDADQIRAATLLSLRGGRPPASGRLEGEDAGEALARRYWVGSSFVFCSWLWILILFVLYELCVELVAGKIVAIAVRIAGFDHRLRLSIKLSRPTN